MALSQPAFRKPIITGSRISAATGAHIMAIEEATPPVCLDEESPSRTSSAETA
jgi:hypothetical protein